MHNEYDVAIIGGGASGMVAAIIAAQENPSLKIILLEKNARVGKKLLSTGNGRCNLTNIDQNFCHYHGGNTWFIQQVIKQFGVEDTLSFFNSIGVETVEENNKIFPRSLQAASVLDLLRYRLSQLSITEHCNFFCKTLEKKNDRFFLCSAEDELICAKRVVVATGGKASPQTGSTGDGYPFLTRFGHQCTALFPALVQVRVVGKKTLPLKGIKVHGKVKAVKNFQVLREECGEILFTDYGLSGPPVFQLSRLASEKEKQLSFVIDLFPEIALNELETILKERRKTLPKELLLVGLLHKVVGREIFRELGTHSDDMSALAQLLKAWSFPICGTQGWMQAQVTVGGIRLNDFSPLTLESKLADGLYACGEVLDVDGDCGGYNLQWAWSSGVTVGRALAKC